jgi:hypothetical protein
VNTHQLKIPKQHEDFFIQEYTTPTQSVRKKNVILPSLGTKISLKTEMATGLSLDRIIGRVTILHSFNAPFTMRDKATEYTKHSF